MNETQMRFLVENYYTNLTTLTEKLNKADYEIKITATYGFNTGGGKGLVNSKVETQAIKHSMNKDSIEELEYKILIVDKAMKILDNREREVIERVKIHRNKLNRIAKDIHKSRKYVFDTRNRALKKMCEFVKEKQCTKN